MLPLSTIFHFDFEGECNCSIQYNLIVVNAITTMLEKVLVRQTNPSEANGLASIFFHMELFNPRFVFGLILLFLIRDVTRFVDETFFTYCGNHFYRKYQVYG